MQTTPKITQRLGATSSANAAARGANLLASQESGEGKLEATHSAMTFNWPALSKGDGTTELQTSSDFRLLIAEAAPTKRRGTP